MNKKVKAIDPQIVVHGTLEKPYYEISYYDTADNKWHIGYSSYDLQTVKEYLDSCFEVVEADVEPVKHSKRLLKQTNFERIKAMSVEEMAAWIYSNCEYLSAEYGACSGANDCSYLLKWLESEVDEDD